MSTPTAVSTIQGAVTGMQDDLLTIAGVGLGIGAAIFAVRKGWKVVRSFI
jgi:hypothetical protein